MPTVLNLLGMKFYYWALEHEPVHIHVKKGNAQAKFALEPKMKLISNSGLKPQELALAEDIIKKNRVYMLEHWYAFFRKNNPKDQQDEK